MRRPLGLILVLIPLAALAGGLDPAGRRSGFDDMAPETRAMQSDDTSNPGMFAVIEGEALWREPPPGGRPSCAGCHGETAMRGVASRHPAYSARAGKPVDLAGQINLCRRLEQGQPAFRAESPPLLALGAYLGLKSRGMAIAPPEDQRLAAARERGKALFKQRIGQLRLACADCHDGLSGKRLGGSVIPQGHPTGYPLYRLEWQAVGSLQRRIRNCMVGVRAEPLPFGHDDLIALELHLAERAAGLAVETPAVRP